MFVAWGVVVSYSIWFVCPACLAVLLCRWYRPDCMLDWPVGGSEAMVNALVRWVGQAAECVNTCSCSCVSMHAALCEQEPVDVLKGP